MPRPRLQARRLRRSCARGVQRGAAARSEEPVRLLYLQKLHEEQHQWDDAYRIREQLVELSGPDTQPRSQAILAFLENERGVEAMKAAPDDAAMRFESAIDLDPDDDAGLPQPRRRAAEAGRHGGSRGRGTAPRGPRPNARTWRSTGSSARIPSGAPHVRGALPAADRRQSTRLACPARARPASGRARRAAGVRFAARRARAQPARADRPSGDLERADAARARSARSSALHRGRARARCSSSIPTSASSATIARRNCSGSARTATSGTRSSKSGSRRRRRRLSRS